MARFAPALLLALSAAWCGTLAGGATSLGSALLAVSFLGIVAWRGASWRDPLRLGRYGRWLPVALAGLAVVSAVASPVPRAGVAGLLLLPAFFGLPGAVARCWREEAARREGLRAVSAVVAGVALWALLDVLLLGTPRAAMPLGHHNLLALWLATLLPVALLPAREQGPWRWLGVGAGLLAVVAVLASRSLMGAAAVVVVAVVWPLTPWPPLPSPPFRPGEGERGREDGDEIGSAGPGTSPLSRWVGGDGRGGQGVRGLLLLLVLALLAVQAPRLLQILRGQDTSAQARTAYAQAGIAGFLDRPLLGQGPGAAAWTVSRFFVPVPGVNPWGEAVGELHSLPLQLAYELGAPGLLLSLALAGTFAVRRWRELRGGPADPALLRAALAGCAGAGVAFLGTASLSVTALPLALAVVAGAALAGGEPVEQASGVVGGRGAVRLYAVLAALALSPLLLAQELYDRALAAELRGERLVARARLEQAIALDPAFPLYRLRLALLQETGGEERRRAAELAYRAAADGRGVAALWTVAGILGQAAARPWAPQALETACALDPLSPFPGWFGMLAEPSGPAAARQGAHALLAEPRLAAAPFWARQPDLYARTLGEVRAWPGIDAAWTRAFLAAVPARGGWTGERQWLALELDVDPAASVSLFVFRRRPWPAEWPVIPLAGDPLARLQDIGPATSRPGAPASSFAPSVCVRQL